LEFVKATPFQTLSMVRRTMELAKLTPILPNDNATFFIQENEEGQNDI